MCLLNEEIHRMFSLKILLYFAIFKPFNHIQPHFFFHWFICFRTFFRMRTLKPTKTSLIWEMIHFNKKVLFQYISGPYMKFSFPSAFLQMAHHLNIIEHVKEFWTHLSIFWFLLSFLYQIIMTNYLHDW